MSLEPVRPIELAEIEAARARIAGTILRTPLVRLDLGRGRPDIRLKLENLQPINAYKLRGAANAVAMLAEAERAAAYGRSAPATPGRASPTPPAKAGVPCTVVAIETAPESKLERMKALGATLVLGVLRHAPGKRWRSGPIPAWRDVRPPVRRSQFHRRPRHDGARDSRRCARRAAVIGAHRRRRAGRRRRRAPSRR